MKNLASRKSNHRYKLKNKKVILTDVDQTIKEELYLAGIPIINEEGKGEVPYTIIGKLGNWTFRRAWYYWIASVKNRINGLPLKIASELHEKKNPTNNEILGHIIRSGGHGGCPHPKDYGADPLYNKELDEQLKKLGYKEEYSEILKENFVPISVGEVSKLCNEGKLNVERYVDCYHIDDQIGLNEFAKFLNKMINKEKELEICTLSAWLNESKTNK